jgi:hypothetical protein
VVGSGCETRMDLTFAFRVSVMCVLLDGYY